MNQDVYQGYDLLNHTLYARFGGAGGPGVSSVHDALGRVTSTHAQVKVPQRQAWAMDDAAKVERLIRNLARTLKREAPGVAASILEGLDEILTVTRLGLPMEPQRSLACTNIIENMNGTIRRVRHNVKRWRDASMALRWTTAGMMEAAKGYRHLQGRNHLPAPRAALAAHQAKHPTLERPSKAA